MQVDAERAFELMYLLFQEKPWLTKPGMAKEPDAPFENEALTFLLTLDAASGWGDCSEPARRLVTTLLLDFMTKLKGSLADHQWETSDDFPPWLQAVQIICAGILEEHPRFSATQ